MCPDTKYVVNTVLITFFASNYLLSDFARKKKLKRRLEKERRVMRQRRSGTT